MTRRFCNLDRMVLLKYENFRGSLGRPLAIRLCALDATAFVSFSTTEWMECGLQCRRYWVVFVHSICRIGFFDFEEANWLVPGAWREASKLCGKETMKVAKRTGFHSVKRISCIFACASIYSSNLKSSFSARCAIASKLHYLHPGQSYLYFKQPALPIFYMRRRLFLS